MVFMYLNAIVVSLQQTSTSDMRPSEHMLVNVISFQASTNYKIKDAE